MFNKIIKRGARKGARGHNEAAAEPRAAAPSSSSSGGAGAAPVTVNHASRASAPAPPSPTSPHLAPSAFAAPSPAAAQPPLLEPLPLLRDVAAAERPGLLLRKLRLVAALFDFSDSLKHPREKEAKRQALLELSFHTDERKLEDAFRRFGKVVDTQIMLERHTNRHRGFGFVTFSDPRAVETAINDMHNKELDGRTISVNRAEPKMQTDDTRYSGGGGGGDRGDYRGGKGDGPPPGNCFECGRAGHWARDCPNPGGGRSGRFPSKFSGGGGRGDRFSGSDRFGDRYVDDRYDSGRYGGYREPIDSRDRYDGGRDRYASDRYPSGGDRFGADRYGAAPDRYAPSGGGGGYGRERERSYERDGIRGGGAYDRSGPRGGASYDRDGPRGGIGGGYDRDGPRGGGADYGSGGPTRYEGGGYRERPGPYDRPSRGGRFDDRY